MSLATAIELFVLLAVLLIAALVYAMLKGYDVSRPRALVRALRTSEGSACRLHKAHSPANLTVEEHHVIPVAWQLFWQPAVAPFPGPDTEGRGMLWDDRTVACCPTGHRNVHHIIVQMMKALGAAGSNDPLDARKAVHGRGAQYETAYLALCRFREVGGSLAELAAHHEYGES